MGLLDLFGLYSILRWLFGQGVPVTATPATSPAARMPPMGIPPTKPEGQVKPVTWPAAPPPGVPSFPAGWEYDEPPPPEVVRRAQQLLPVLWGKGSGSRQQEMTGGRWITYVAEVVRGGSRGVTAYRIKGTKPAAAAPAGAPYAPPISRAPAAAPTAAATPSAASAVPAAYRTQAPSTQAQTPGTYTAPTTVVTPGPMPMATSTPLPVVSTPSDVQRALNSLGYAPALVVDGKIGPKSTAAIHWYQRQHTGSPDFLVDDGIAGPMTRGSLARSLAAQGQSA